jgi:hypothetical protein
MRPYLLLLLFISFTTNVYHVFCQYVKERISYRSN